MDEFRSLMIEAQTISRFGAHADAISSMLDRSKPLDQNEKLQLFSALLKSRDIPQSSRDAIEKELGHVLLGHLGNISHRFTPQVLNGINEETVLFDILSKTNYTPASFLFTVRELLTDRNNLSRDFLNKLVKCIEDRFSSSNLCFGIPSESDKQESLALIDTIKLRVGNPIEAADRNRGLPSPFRTRIAVADSSPPKKLRV